MRKIILLEHISLDGFAAGPNGEMDWIKVDSEMFDLVGKLTQEADAALYGRVTYQMMEAYWPEAGEEPGASKHDKEHSEWYNRVQKFVLSQTMQGNNKDKTTFIGHEPVKALQQFKQQGDENILLIGSPSVVRLLTEHKLIDEYWLFMNPILIGKGIPVFPEGNNRIGLNLQSTKTFPCGVSALHYITT